MRDVSPSRLFLVMNPSARSFRSREQWPVIFDGLRRRNVNFDFALTEKDGDPAELARMAISRGFDTVVAVGGDGTINDVLNGLFDEDDDRAKAVFGVLYTGTSPDFCQNHDIPLDLEQALDLLVSGTRQNVDVCRISHRLQPGGRVATRHFSCCANFGLGAAVARGANSGLRKAWGDTLGTLFSLLSAITRYGAPTFRVRVDGKEQEWPRLYNLFIGKGRLVASGIKLDLDIEPDDGLMYVLPVHGMTRGRIFSLLPRAYSGSLPCRFPPMFARRVEILSWGEASEVEYDGDPHGFLPAEIRILPKSLPLIRPGYKYCHPCGKGRTIKEFYRAGTDTLENVCHG